MFSRRLCVCLSVCPSDISPVSEVDEGNNYKLPINISVALNFGNLCSPGSPSLVLCSEEICHAPNTSTLQHDKGWSGCAMCWLNVQCRSVLLIYR